MMAEDLDLPLSSKSFELPRSKRDRAYFFLMMFGIPFAVLWEAFVILPNYYNHFCAAVLFHTICTLFIVHNVLGNMYFLRKVDASGSRLDLPSVLKPGWKYCYPCCVNSPPRSYHCTVCNLCILKRDHHCAFAGGCVGYYNHRYYLLAVLYTFIGAFYGIYYQWDYVMLTLGDMGLWKISCFLAPHFAFIFGWISAYSVLVIVLHDIGLTILFSMSYLLINQLIAISRGQTQYEKKHQILDYNIKLSRNWIDVLGFKWYLTWISPFVQSKLPGNGIKFTLKSEFESVKDV